MLCVVRLVSAHAAAPLGGMLTRKRDAPLGAHARLLPSFCQHPLLPA